PEELEVLGRVPDGEGLLVGRVEALAARDDAPDVVGDLFGLAGIRGLIDEVVDPLLAGDRTERRARDEALLVVATRVARVLDLLLENPDEQKWRAAEHDDPSDRLRVLAEHVLGHLPTEEEHAPLLGHVARVDEAAALLRVDVAHRPELRRDARDVDRDR